jgi:hypothetical protein
MKFMISWKIQPGCTKAAVERFLKTGASIPTGVKTIGRWHAPGFSYEWLVVEGDATGVAEVVAPWDDLLVQRLSLRMPRPQAAWPRSMERNSSAVAA